VNVILKDDVKKVGKMGDIVDVADGHARNYLIPKGLAIEANTKNIKSMGHEKRIMQGKAKKLKNSAQELASRISEMTLVIKAKAGDEEKLFGSVTTMDIAEALRSEGIEIDKKKILLDEPIIRLGSYSVNVRFHHDVSTQLTVQVIQE